MSEGRKDDQGKLRWDLLPLDVVEELVEIYEFGAKKYGENNWRTIKDGYKRCRAAMFRHLAAYDKGERNDQESGKSHLAHAAWNALSMLYFAGKETRVVPDISYQDEVTHTLSKLERKLKDMHDKEELLPEVGQKVKFEFCHRDGTYNGIGKVAHYMIDPEGESFLVEEIDEFGAVLSYNLKREDIKEILQ